MKKRMKHGKKAKEKSLAEKHAQLFAPFPFIPVSDVYDLRQPDFRPMINSVVSGGAGQAPVETWSSLHAELGRGSK
jgi:hypothetical protein